MDAGFWHRKWERNEIGFHERDANPLLVTYFNDLFLSQGSRVFVPLCGKTRDIHWLVSHGYRVAGVELSEIAVGQLFSELGVDPVVSVFGKISKYSAHDIDVFVADIFDLSRSDLGRVDAIYDRAALVAFPETNRSRYAAHLIEITKCAPQLLICYNYDHRLLEGPPFSVGQEEVTRQYLPNYDLILLASADIPGGFKGICAAAEHVWLLKKKNDA
jgi:thiopurine S-methyltransferase